MSATDSDVGVNAQITYTLSSEISNEAVAHHEQEFLINPQTGAITTNKPLDRETMSGKDVSSLNKNSSLKFILSNC